MASSSVRQGPCMHMEEAHGCKGMCDSCSPPPPPAHASLGSQGHPSSHNMIRDDAGRHMSRAARDAFPPIVCGVRGTTAAAAASPTPPLMRCTIKIECMRPKQPHGLHVSEKERSGQKSPTHMGRLAGGYDPTRFAAECDRASQPARAAHGHRAAYCLPTADQRTQRAPWPQRQRPWEQRHTRMRKL